MIRVVSFVFVVLGAACGGKSAPPSAPAGDDHHYAMTGSGADDGHAHHHPSDAAGSGSAALPEGEPVKPSEPPPPDPAQMKAQLLAAETAAFEEARSVFETHCARCHKEGGKQATGKKREHFDMTTYPFGGHHADAIGAEIRKSLGMNGDKPRMPLDKKGSVQGNELALIRAWADAFDKAHAAGAHEGTPKHDHGHDHGHKH